MPKILSRKFTSIIGVVVFGIAMMVTVGNANATLIGFNFSQDGFFSSFSGEDGYSVEGMFWGEDTNADGYLTYGIGGPNPPPDEVTDAMVNILDSDGEIALSLGFDVSVVIFYDLADELIPIFLFAIDVDAPELGSWVTFDGGFIPPSGPTAQIILPEVAFNTFNPVQVSAKVPEPSSMLLFSIGLIGLAGIGMRRRGRVSALQRLLTPPTPSPSAATAREHLHYRLMRGKLGVSVYPPCPCQ